MYTVLMETISYTGLRQNLRKVMDHILDDSIAYRITRKGQEPVVMISQRDYDSLYETLHLLSTPANKAALEESRKQVERGEFVSWDELKNS